MATEAFTSARLLVTGASARQQFAPGPRERAGKLGELAGRGEMWQRIDAPAMLAEPSGGAAAHLALL